MARRGLVGIGRVSIGYRKGIRLPPVNAAVLRFVLEPERSACNLKSNHQKLERP